MPPKSLAEQAAALAAKLHHVREPLVSDHAEAVDPTSGKPVYRFRVVDATHANGPSYTLILTGGGEPLDAARAAESVFDHNVLTTSGATPRLAGPVTIQPDTNVLTLNPGDSLQETITVTIPKNAGPAKADVYFLADTTGSMTGILNAVKAGANNILAALNALGVDMAFGVGNYKDFESGDPYAFRHQISPTNSTAPVTAAINTWSALGGGDIPEAGLFALDSLAVPPGGPIGWRAGSKRIVVWFGDAPGHDPICTQVSGVAAAITEATVTAKLAAESIAVLAISTANPGLDNDPKSGAAGYVAKCGPPGGLPGQGTRIANSTGGVFVTGINAGNIVNTIVNLVKGAVAVIQNVKLTPSASVAPFVTSITPAGGYGPLAADQDHTLTFEVTFNGALPCRPEAQAFGGTIDVVADGAVVASKKVLITVPRCVFVYSVKFVCGVQPECECACTPVQPGKYATEINIHNYSLLQEVQVLKRIVPVVLAGAPMGREPQVAAVRAEDRIVLPPQTATMDDCCRIAELLFGGSAPSPMPLTIGFLELTASAPIAVTAVYTTSGLKSPGVSIRVEQIAQQ
ncbi:MAG: hypothetical protein ACRD9L_16125 [Bryobacteraceae bacterium]